MSYVFNSDGTLAPGHLVTGREAANILVQQVSYYGGEDVPDLVLTIDAQYFGAEDLREAARWFNEMADSLDLMDFTEEDID